MPAQQVAPLAEAAGLALLGLPLKEEFVDAGWVRGCGGVVAVAAVLGVQVGVLTDVLEIESGFGRGRWPLWLRLRGGRRMLL
jgi:hypothetical protein